MISNFSRRSISTLIHSNSKLIHQNSSRSYSFNLFSIISNHTDNRNSQKMSQERTVVSTPNAPAAIGPYSQAIKANGQVFVSGCLGLDKTTMDFVSQTDVSAQTQKALENMSEILTAAGSSMNKVVKTTILLQSMDDFAAVNKVYSTFFPVDPPARSTFAVACLPKKALVEIEAIALA
ncbi:hypothetical protein DLAC_09541 [Tieghemostelium lacteum]|uniref:Uncharacterized protein n=1 Tax=Tieghemostelium lacteum TaxID=361077 RepID=A0A151Z6M1_TIELA|nr:hypothetical protein DLAC_09541 [Tieghemostelium lacteum]|eukprot:KYQ89585.1 hypothetical protein DLAC_09541 [Tieghemostelium lacteum]